jgi:hypothetical protein
MKLLNYKSLFYFGLLLNILICSYLWNYVSLPFDSSKSAVGILTLKNINPFNDSVRYILFILIPLSYYFLGEYFNDKKKVIEIKDLLIPNFEHDNNFNFKDISIISAFLIILIFFDFFSADFKVYLLEDVFHDGDQLTPAINYYLNKGFWTSSFTVHGGYDFFFPTLAWKIFSVQSIGSHKFLGSLGILIVKILSIIFIYYLIKFFDFQKKNKVIFFTIFSLFILSLSNFDYIIDQLTFRDVFSLIFLIFFIQLCFNKKKFKLNCLLTLTVFLAIISNVDIGSYLFFTLLTYCIYLGLSKQFKDVFQIVSFFLFLILLFIFIFGMEEFNAMLFHQINLVKNIDAVHALEYPQPFFSIGEQHGARATKALLFQLISGFIIVSAVMQKKNKNLQNQKIFLIFLYILCLVSFKNALGRSDSYHIKLCSEFQSIIIFFYILSILEILLEKIKLIKFNKLSSSLFSVVLIFVFILNEVNLSNISNFRLDAKQLILAEDNKFFTRKYNKKISLINEIFKDENCIQNFSTELLIPYLLKKPSCTKYFSSWLASGYDTEMDYIKYLKKKMPKLILYEAPGYNVDGIDTRTRLKYVNKYILENYEDYYSYEGLRIFKKNKKEKK